MIESHKRSIIKAITWRILATFVTMIVVYVFTKEIVLSLEVGGIALGIKLIVYYFHERVWGKISWGTKEHPLSHLPVDKELKPEDMEKIKEQLEDLGYIE